MRHPVFNVVQVESMSLRELLNLPKDQKEVVCVLLTNIPLEEGYLCGQVRRGLSTSGD